MHIQTHPTFAYTHPTSHTNTLKSLSFHTKKKTKDTATTKFGCSTMTKLTPITKFQIILTKFLIKKTIKSNQKKKKKSHDPLHTHDKNLTIQIYLK